MGSGGNMDKVIIINYSVSSYKTEVLCRKMLCRMPVKHNILPMDLYSSIQSCMEANIPFSVCNLSEEEFKLLESKITRYGNLDRLISSPRHDTYVSCKFMITRDSDYSKILFADYDNPRKRGTYSFDFKEETFNYLENSIPFTEYYAPWIAKNGYTNGFKIYTTETYKDVLKYYQEIADKKQNPNMKQKQKNLK